MAILVKPEEVIPLLDAVGPEGMYITAYCDNAQQAEELVCAVAPYRRVAKERTLAARVKKAMHEMSKGEIKQKGMKTCD